MHVQRERVPLRHHAEAGDDRQERARYEGNQAKHRTDRQPKRLAVDQHAAAGQIQIGGLQREVRAVERDERRGGEQEEYFALDSQHSPEHIRESKRIEPEGVDVVGECRPAPEDEQRESSEEEESTASPRLTRRRPVYGGHFTPKPSTWTFKL